MTEQDRKPAAPAPDDLDDKVDQLEDDAEAMERYDRAIPLPDETGEADDGVGPVTGLVP